MKNFNHLISLISRNVSLLTMMVFVVGIIVLATATTPGATNTVFAQDPTETPHAHQHAGAGAHQHAGADAHQHAGTHVHAATHVHAGAHLYATTY